MFTLQYKDKNSKARAGIIKTYHSEILTPVFMPVGTLGTVKAIENRILKDEIDAKIILGNTYHLYLRPGMDVIQKLNGLHKFMNWQNSILTDSGGFQVFSLKQIRKLDEKGVEFQSHIDGSKHYFSPSKVVEIQKVLGSDITMVLDECVEYPATRKYVEDSSKLSLKWAKESKLEFDKQIARYNHQQYLFGIAQGGMYKDLREKYCHEMNNIGFDGNAIGGLSVGENSQLMYETVNVCTNILDESKARYLMGVGKPENILECIELGVDMFDCVMPTRNARNGQLFTSKGVINIRNSKYKYDENVIDETLNNYSSNNYSLSYLRHLFSVNEILGHIIASQHNIAFYLWLVRKAREEIIKDNFRNWKNEFLDGYLT